MRSTGPALRPASPRSRRSPRPSGPSPKRAARGAGVPGFSISSMSFRAAIRYSLAGVPGFEPGLSVLETDVLTVDTIPLRSFPISLRLFVVSVLAAAATEFAEFQAIRRGLLILSRHVVPTLARLTLKHNVIAWHKLFPIFDCQLPIVSTRRAPLLNRQSAIGNRQCL